MAVEQHQFQDVYRETFSIVWRYAASHGIHGGDIDDVVQEVFLVVHRRLADFEGRSSVKTWVVGIAINVIRSYRRRRATRKLGEDMEWAPEMQDLRSTPEALLQAQQDADFLYEALEGLTEFQREAFVLCDLAEVPAVQAAAQLELNEDAFRARLRTARQLIAERIRRRKR